MGTKDLLPEAHEYSEDLEAGKQDDWRTAWRDLVTPAALEAFEYRFQGMSDRDMDERTGKQISRRMHKAFNALEKKHGYTREQLVELGLRKNGKSWSRRPSTSQQVPLASLSDELRQHLRAAAKQAIDDDDLESLRKIANLL